MSKRAGPTQVCHLTPLPGTPPSPPRARSGPCRARGAPDRRWMLEGRYGTHPCPRLFFPVASERIPCIILGVSRLPPPRIRTLCPRRPLWKLPNTHVLPLPTAAAALRAPGTASAQPHSPASPVPAPPSLQWRRRLGKVAAAACWPACLQPPPLPLPARGPASTAAAARALSRQSASREPIPAFSSAGGGTFAPPGRLVGSRQ